MRSIDLLTLRRLLRRVEEAPSPSGARVDGPCWLWTGARCRGGYGKFSVCGKSQKAHRVAYALLVGPIPDDLVVDHLCRQRACVNPAHHELLTSRQNTLRGIMSRRRRPGQLTLLEEAV